MTSRNIDIMKVLEHDHPLKLVDLESKYQHNEEDTEEEEEDEDEDDIIKEEFRSICARCDQDISEYHRYYYTCTDSCDYSLHKFCAEAPEMLKITSHHSHPLNLRQQHWYSYNYKCDLCQGRYKHKEVCYRCSCFDQCHVFSIHLSCGVNAEDKRLYHPSHPHPLECAISRSILCVCNACGKEHKGIFYSCTTCSSFTIHSDCAFLPKKLLIQKTTDEDFYHPHPLTLSYSFPEIDQAAKHYPECRVCGDDFLYYQNLWIYKCDKCRYYAHLNCATSRREPFMSIFSSPGIGKLIKNFKDDDYPDLLCLPFSDQSYSIPKHVLGKQIKSQTVGAHEVSLKHDAHEHPLILVENNDASQSVNSLLSCHDPMKRIELLCNGCIRPITATPFYKCANEDQRCKFVLQEWCTRLPSEIENHPGHNHTLILITKPPNFFNVFQCYSCNLPCNGFAYGCSFQCEYFICVSCALVPEKITHDAHPNHLLTRVQATSIENAYCRKCFRNFDPPSHLFSFSCNICNFHLHPECAYLSPGSIRHKFDKHPLNLSYLPVENHKSEYFCEICEDELNPQRWFYHCHKCAQSMHSACASLILECETSYGFRIGVHPYINIKFEGTHTVECHPHPLSFVQGIESDGNCAQCRSYLEYNMIFRFGICKYAIHFKCCAALSHSRIPDNLTY